MITIIIAALIVLGITGWAILAEPTTRHGFKRQGKPLTDRSWEHELFGRGQR